MSETQQKKYDAAVIGAGPGGYTAAVKCAQLGLSTAIIEKDTMLGGTCLTVGCIPSKALLSSSRLYEQITKESEHLGIKVDGARADFSTMQKRKEEIVKKLTGGVSSLMKKNKIDIFSGAASIKQPGIISVGDTEINAGSIIIATGSRPVELPFLPFDHKTVIDSTDALSLKKIPKTMAVVGGGIIGLEMASVYSRLGTEVTVIELLPEILPGWDRKLAADLRRILTSSGITILTKQKVTGIKTVKGSRVLESLDSGGNVTAHTAEKILVAVGRTPLTQGLGLEELGVEFDGPRIKTDEHFRTSLAGIYAVGDVINGPMLAHKAAEDGVKAAEVISGGNSRADYRAVPGIVYTHPEGASIGKTEEECKEQNIPVKKGTFRFAANGRALSTGETAGWVKVIAAKEDDSLLGVHILGDHAGELIQEAAAVMEYRGTAEDIARIVHGHPGLSEALKEAAEEAAFGMSINSL